MAKTPPTVRVRPARPQDAEAIHALIRALAAYEREPDAVEGSVADLRAHLFGAAPQVWCHVAEVHLGGPGDGDPATSASRALGGTEPRGGGRVEPADPPGQAGQAGQAEPADPPDAEGWEVAGIALWYVTFSTWKVRHGIWLEDLFVVPEHRGLGLGRLLLAELGRIALERGYPRFEWWVLDWNTPAHGFYRSLGAVPQDEWTVWRLTDAPLAALGADGR